MRYGSVKLTPLTWKRSPSADTGFGPVLLSNRPGPLTLKVLLPGSAAVPRSTVPPVMSRAG